MGYFGLNAKVRKAAMVNRFSAREKFSADHAQHSMNDFSTLKNVFDGMEHIDNRF